MSTQKVVPSTVSGVVSATKPRPRPPLPRPKPRPADLFPALRPRPPGARIICLNFSNVRVCVVTHRKSQPPHRLLGRPFPFQKLKSGEWSHMISVILLYDTTHSLYKNTREFSLLYDPIMDKFCNAFLFGVRGCGRRAHAAKRVQPICKKRDMLCKDK